MLNIHQKTIGDNWIKFYASLFLLFISSCSQQNTDLTPGAKVYNLTFKPIHNLNASTLNEYKDNIVIVNFFASWCYACAQEVPTLNELYNIIKKNNKIKFIAIAVNDNEASLKKWIIDNKVSYPIGIDHLQKAENKFKLKGFPETIILKKGLKIAMFPDPDTFQPTIKALGPKNWTNSSFVRYLLKLSKQS